MAAAARATLTLLQARFDDEARAAAEQRAALVARAARAFKALAEALALRERAEQVHAARLRQEPFVAHLLALANEFRAKCTSTESLGRVACVTPVRL